MLQMVLTGGLTVEQGVKTTATNTLTCLNRSAVLGKTVADCRRPQVSGRGALHAVSLRVARYREASVPFCPRLGDGPGSCEAFSLTGLVWHVWGRTLFPGQLVTR